jgi:hypothetical protein
MSDSNFHERTEREILGRNTARAIRRVRKTLAHYLQENEELLAVAEAQVGPHPGFIIADGQHATYFRLYEVGLTQHRLLLLKTSQFLPDRLALRKRLTSLSRHRLQVLSKETMGFLVMVVAVSGGKTLNLNFEPGWKKQGLEIAKALGARRMDV